MGVCQEYQCRNADGTDTSPDCNCSEFEFTETDGFCRYEQHCFSGNLLFECRLPGDGSVWCQCFEALEPVTELTALPLDTCGGGLSDDEVFDLCGWSLP